MTTGTPKKQKWLKMQCKKTIEAAIFLLEKSI
jgi:hypothetical protein